MQTTDAFLALCILCAAWHVVSTLLVYNALQKRGMPVSFLWLRALAPKYAFLYRETTRAETGRVGPLFGHWIISINLALAFALIAIIGRL